MESSVVIPEPTFLNLEWLFFQINSFLEKIFGDGTISLEKILEVFKAVGVVLIILVITILLYTLVRMYEITQEGKTKKEKISNSSSLKSSDIASFDSGGKKDIAHESSVSNEKKVNETWRRIRDHALSDNESDWRLAIIEADIYMDKLLDQKGYHGETVSDKLKQMTEHQLASIQFAWEGHKVRNKIAHEGANFVLTMPEVRKVLLMYEVVFRELGAID